MSTSNNPRATAGGREQSGARIRSYLHQLLHLDEPPRRTALAFAVGTFIAFSPMYGLHTLSVLACTWAFRLNFLALMAGALINNPWTMVPILGATLWTGLQILGHPPSDPVVSNTLTLESLHLLITPYLLPFVIGALVLGVAGAGLAYPLAYWFINRYRGKSREPLEGQLRT